MAPVCKLLMVEESLFNKHQIPLEDKEHVCQTSISREDNDGQLHTEKIQTNYRGFSPSQVELLTQLIHILQSKFMKNMCVGFFLK